MKRSFLFKKGLTEAEISEAFRRTGSAMSELPHRMIHMNTHQSWSSKLRDILNILLLIGGFSYSLRYLWKVWKIYHHFIPAEVNIFQKFLSKYLGFKRQEKTPQERLVELSETILKTAETLQKSLNVFESSIERYSKKLDSVSEQIKQVTQPYS